MVKLAEPRNSRKIRIEKGTNLFMLARVGDVLEFQEGDFLHNHHEYLKWGKRGELVSWRNSVEIITTFRKGESDNIISVIYEVTCYNQKKGAFGPVKYGEIMPQDQGYSKNFLKLNDAGLWDF